RTRTISRHIRAVFDTDEGSHISQQSTASSTAESKYAKLQTKYFHEDESDARDSGLSSGSMEYSEKDLPLPQTYLLRKILLLEELINLNSRSESLKDNLSLEIKVHDAALSLRKLHANNKNLVSQADEQLNAANRKLNHIRKEMWDVAQRSWSRQQQLMQHTAAVLVIAATQPMEQVSSQGSFTEPSTLKDALAALSVKEQELQILRTQSLAPKCQCYKLDIVKKELDEQKAKVTLLGREVNDNRELSQILAGERIDKQELFRQVQSLKHELKTLKAASFLTAQENLEFKLKEATEEADLLYRCNMETTQKLSQLYHKIPEIIRQIWIRRIKTPIFTVEKFITKIDGIIQENNDLIDKILELQERNVQLTRRLANPFPNPPNEEMLSISEVEGIITELKSLLEQVESKADHLQSELAREKSNNQALYEIKQNLETDLNSKIHQLQSDLETKELLCAKYQQILGAL
ncbi:hypothetical protein L0F63_001908, partial [Massospora cicadina]